MHQLRCMYVAVRYSSFLVYLSQVFISELLGGETSPKPSDFLNTKFHFSNLPVPTQYYSYSRNIFSCINHWLYKHSYQRCLSSPYKIMSCNCTHGNVRHKWLVNIYCDNKLYHIPHSLTFHKKLRIKF